MQEQRSSWIQVDRRVEGRWKLAREWRKRGKDVIT
jgi:hypothetical protein